MTSIRRGESGSQDNILVFGSNPEGRHGAGLALVARESFGARYGRGRGLHGNSYALVTKNLTAGFLEASTGIKYRKYGGIFARLIRANIIEMYECARANPEKMFWVPYQLDVDNLNGYSSHALRLLFLTDPESIPHNVVFHESMRSYYVPTPSKRW